MRGGSPQTIAWCDDRLRFPLHHGHIRRGDEERAGTRCTGAMKLAPVELPAASHQAAVSPKCRTPR